MENEITFQEILSNLTISQTENQKGLKELREIQAKNEEETKKNFDKLTDSQSKGFKELREIQKETNYDLVKEQKSRISVIYIDGNCLLLSSIILENGIIIKKIKKKRIKNMKCPSCNSTEKVKNGFLREKQRYKCKNCKHQYTHSIQKQKRAILKVIAYMLYLEGLRFHSIGGILRVSNVTVFNWGRKFSTTRGTDLETNTKETEVIEIDEMWHYLGKKKET